jgi:hypothetical protein
MGSRVARRLLDAGHDLVVWNRTTGKADPLVAAGAHRANSPREPAGTAEFVITMLADPHAPRAVTEPARVGSSAAAPARRRAEGECKGAERDQRGHPAAVGGASRGRHARPGGWTRPEVTPRR